jgi:hypothetical protein
MIDNKKLTAKRDSLISLCDLLGVSFNDIPFMYPDINFDNFMTRQLAQESLSLDVSTKHSNRLEKICNIPFNRDNRTATEYAIDLIYGWFAEDIVIEFLQMQGFDVERTGVDKEREFLSSGRIKSDLDISITVGKVTKSFDIYFDSQGYWSKTDKIDVRESKWKSLEKEGASIICASNSGFGIIDSSIEYTFGPNPLWGGKNCATVKGIKSKLVSPEVFIKDLKLKMKRND